MLRLTLAFLVLATAAGAHEPDIGPNGGKRVDAGPYRVELVPGDGTVRVHLILDDGSAVATDGMTGVAILLVGGKPVRVPLVAGTAGVLTGAASGIAPDSVTGAVQLTAPDGQRAQAKF